MKNKYHVSFSPIWLLFSILFLCTFVGVFIMKIFQPTLDLNIEFILILGIVGWMALTIIFTFKVLKGE